MPSGAGVCAIVQFARDPQATPNSAVTHWTIGHSDYDHALDAELDQGR